jgi:hypothetical protein
METILIGYLARCIPPKLPCLPLPTVEEVCSVAADIIGLRDPLRIDNWYHQGRHNALNHFDNEEIAWTVLRDEIQIRLEQDGSSNPPWRAEIVRPCAERFDLFAHKVLPVLFVKEKQKDLSLPELRVAPIPADYQRLGYDTVGWNNYAPFRCSPLICNGEAVHQNVNRYCLFDELGPALDLARRFSGSNWEPFWPGHGHCDPGPYCVVEVWRKAKPFPEPARCGPPFAWPQDLLLSLVKHKLGHGRVWERNSK